MTADLFNRNRTWAVRKEQADPGFFRRLSRQQAPEYLWIGCSDSRVPANEIVGLDPGELFVHRNVANLAIPTDLNFLTVLAYAVDALRVRHIIVCGHYGCGGVQAALRPKQHPIVDAWIEPLRAAAHDEARHLQVIGSEADRVNALCEINVRRQVMNVARTTVVRDAWACGQSVAIHGWIYGLADGLLRDLDVTISAPS